MPRIFSAPQILTFLTRTRNAAFLLCQRHVECAAWTIDGHFLTTPLCLYAIHDNTCCSSLPINGILNKFAMSRMFVWVYTKLWNKTVQNTQTIYVYFFCGNDCQ